MPLTDQQVSDMLESINRLEQIFFARTGFWSYVRQCVADRQYYKDECERLRAAIARMHSYCLAEGDEPTPAAK